MFFGSDDGRLYALDKTNGGLAWDFSPGYSMSYNDVNNYITTPILSDPVVENSIVYISAKGNIYALDAQTTDTNSGNFNDKESNNDVFILFIYLLLILIGTCLLFHIYIKNKQPRK